jgi:hypothetical protein
MFITTYKTLLAWLLLSYPLMISANWFFYGIIKFFPPQFFLTWGAIFFGYTMHLLAKRLKSKD